MTMKAVVVRELNNYSVESVSLDPPGPGELGVRMKATGVCHSDLSCINGTLPFPMPLIVGHEGAGIVEQLGEGVSGFEVGDHVVLSFIPVCGQCGECQRSRPWLCAAGRDKYGTMLDGSMRVHDGNGNGIHVMQFLGCMAEHVVVPAISAVKIDADLPLDKAALIGCGVMTGVGSVINTAQVTPGASVAVFGCGGVGLSIIQGARVAGAGQVIAVDLSDHKLDLARLFGADETVNGANNNAVERIHALSGGGVDFAFEAVGVPALMEQAYEAVSSGGVMTVVGVASLSDTVQFNGLMISMSSKTIKGSLYGSANPPVDFPKLLDFYRRGRINLDDMVSKTYSIDEAPQAFEDMVSNVNARGVILFD